MSAGSWWTRDGGGDGCGGGGSDGGDSGGGDGCGRVIMLNEKRACMHAGIQGWLADMQLLCG